MIVIISILVYYYLIMSLLVYKMVVAPIMYDLEKRDRNLKTNRLFKIKQSLLWPFWLWR